MAGYYLAVYNNVAHTNMWQNWIFNSNYTLSTAANYTFKMWNNAYHKPPATEIEHIYWRLYYSVRVQLGWLNAYRQLIEYREIYDIKAWSQGIYAHCMEQSVLICASRSDADNRAYCGEVVRLEQRASLDLYNSNAGVDNVPPIGCSTQEHYIDNDVYPFKTWKRWTRNRCSSTIDGNIAELAAVDGGYMEEVNSTLSISPFHGVNNTYHCKFRKCRYRK